MRCSVTVNAIPNISKDCDASTSRSSSPRYFVRCLMLVATHQMTVSHPRRSQSSGIFPSSNTSGLHPACCPMGNSNSFPRSKLPEAWIHMHVAQGLNMYGMTPLHIHTSWRYHAYLYKNMCITLKLALLHGLMTDYQSPTQDYLCPQSSNQPISKDWWTLACGEKEGWNRGCTSQEANQSSPHPTMYYLTLNITYYLVLLMYIYFWFFSIQTYIKHLHK